MTGAQTAGTPLWSLTAGDLARGYRAGAFTSSDVIEAVLGRIAACDGRINAMVAIDSAGARAAAAASTERWASGAALSALDGVPISVKDNLFLAGVPATWGSRLYDGFVPDRDEPAIARLRAAGAVLFGKTNVPEFTVQGYTSNLVFGTTCNPHALDRTPGGSTGGGAAAVAAGFGPIAIGTDGGGSIRRPAAHCGLHAWRPGLGAVARGGGFPQILADFETVGVIARSADDIDLVKSVIAGPDPCDWRSLGGATGPAIPECPRIAYLSAIGGSPVDARIAAAVDRFADRLAAGGAEVVPVTAPFDADRATAVWGTVMTTGLAWLLAGFAERLDVVNPSARATAADGAKRTTGDLLDALAAVPEIRAEAGALFTAFDLLLTPATAALAWEADRAFPTEIAGQPVGPRGHAVFTGWMNVAGLPAVTVPLALTTDAGGIGAQLVAGHGRDRALIDFAKGLSASDVLSPAPLANLEPSS